MKQTLVLLVLVLAGGATTFAQPLNTLTKKEKKEGCSFSKERTFQSRDESQQIAVW